MYPGTVLECFNTGRQKQEIFDSRIKDGRRPGDPAGGVGWPGTSVHPAGQ